MANTLLNYLNKRLEEREFKTQKKEETAGPVITISREVGCNGIRLATKIAARLNRQKTTETWNVLSKEVFYESAKELNLAPEKLRKYFKKSDRYVFEEILKAFGDKNYKSEKRIANTVRDVVFGLAVDGFNIIVGRASHIIASDVKNAFHIRLIAPFEYRINTIINNNGLSRKEAEKFINKVETERIAFRRVLNEKHLREDLFDITINRASFDDEQAVDLIEAALNMKESFFNAKHEKMKTH